MWSAAPSKSATNLTCLAANPAAASSLASTVADVPRYAVCSNTYAHASNTCKGDMEDNEYTQTIEGDVTDYRVE